MTLVRALVFGFSIALSGCAASVSHRAPLPPALAASEERAIALVLDDWHAAAAKADEERYFAHLSDDAIFLGTDETERWDKGAFRSYAHPHFAKGKAWSFQATRRSVMFDRPDLAHFDEQLATAGLGPARGSGVVEKRAGVWQIVHYNLAITVPNDRFDTTKEAATSAKLVASRDDALKAASILAGSWVGLRSKNEVVEEHWTHADAGSMLGSGRTSTPGKTVFFEHLRIEARSGGEVVYVAQPLGKPPTEFRLDKSDKASVSFANPAHDWPKRLTYRRDGQVLRVRIEGDPGQPVEEWALEAAMVVRTAVE